MSLVDTPFWRAWVVALLLFLWMWVVGAVVLAVLGAV